MKTNALIISQPYEDEGTPKKLTGREMEKGEISLLSLLLKLKGVLFLFIDGSLAISFFLFVSCGYILSPGCL